LQPQLPIGAPAEGLLADSDLAASAERRRRLREIAAKFESSRTIVPYRLNLMFVPALAFAVDVRRGERRYPFHLRWLPAAGCFGPLHPALRCN
jgi:hypothetical protein